MARRGFIQGLRTCVEMLENMDLDECAITGVTIAVRKGRQQDNAVRRTLGLVLERGDPDELEGFCAALTDIAATANEYGDWSRAFTRLAEKQLNAA